MVRAGYDAQRTTDQNKKSWMWANGETADQTNDPAAREILRNRSRYEVGNNTYAKGLSLTLANDCVGTGPRLQLQTGKDELNRDIERDWAAWSATVGLPEKLRTMRQSKMTDGEVFAQLVTNPEMEGVELDVRLIEADRVTCPASCTLDSRNIDGVELDQYGNVSGYTVVSADQLGLAKYGGSYKTIPASQMMHWFRADRPGQHRGVPEITPALELFIQLRRYTLATLKAAETAADLAVIWSNDAPAYGDSEVQDGVDHAFDTVEIEPGMIMAAPDGYKPWQIKAEQPVAGYAEFKHELLNEIARCLNVPYNIAAGNSSGYNYSSGKLDHQTYYKSVRIEQAALGEVVLDRIFAAWLKEAMVVNKYQLTRSEAATIKHVWFFDGMEPVDELKSANAQAKRLESGTTTLAFEYAKQGLDWEDQIAQQARELQKKIELGLIVVDDDDDQGDEDNGE